MMLDALGGASERTALMALAAGVERAASAAERGVATAWRETT